VFVTVALLPVLGACATEDVGTTSGFGSDASVARDGAPEARRIRITLQPLYDWQEDQDGFGEAIPIGDAKVCVARARPWGGVWSDFVPVNGPCTTTMADQPIVLDGAPGVSELVVTAEKEGYWSSVFAVTTDLWDQDMTLRAPPGRGLRMRRRHAPWVNVPPGITVSPDLGAMNAGAFTCFGDCRFAGGARMELADPSGDGPFYHINGKLDPNATSTSAGTRINAGATTFDAFVVDDGPVTRGSPSFSRITSIRA
jgi:hypothetical protein